LITLFSIPFSCKNKQQTSEVQKIVAEWIGKEVKFPNRIKCLYMGKEDTADIEFIKPYRILVYIDSIGCSSCKFKLSVWQDLMRDSSFLISDNVDFLFYFQPQNKEDIIFLLKVERFKYPIYLDTENEINRLNNFPGKIEYQCFLLDKDNRVLLVGNPTLNPKIWELYKEVITGKKAAPQEKATAVEPDKTAHDFGAVQTGESSYATFRLKNTGEHPLIISRVVTSCGCASAAWERQPVAAGQSAEVRVEMKPDEEGFFSKTAEVHCNAGNSAIRLTLIGTASRQGNSF
jgi:hypothetical protein